LVGARDSKRDAAAARRGTMQGSSADRGGICRGEHVHVRRYRLYTLFCRVREREVWCGILSVHRARTPFVVFCRSPTQCARLLGCGRRIRDSEMLLDLCPSGPSRALTGLLTNSSAGEDAARAWRVPERAKPSPINSLNFMIRSRPFESPLPGLICVSTHSSTGMGKSVFGVVLGFSVMTSGSERIEWKGSPPPS
jgi:hypothetical protein